MASPLSDPPLTSQYVLAPCNDIATTRFHLRLQFNSLSPSTLDSLNAKPCHDVLGTSTPNLEPGEAHVGSVKLVDNGRFLSDATSTHLDYMEIPSTAPLIHFGLELSKEVQYTMTLLEASGKTVNDLPPPHLIMSDTYGATYATEDRLGVELYRYLPTGNMNGGTLEATPSQEYFPRSGIFTASKLSESSTIRTDFGIMFHCSTDPNSQFYQVDDPDNIKTQLTLKMSFASTAYPYEQYNDILLPFRKYCAPLEPEVGWWNGGYGTDDDLGHLAGALPLLIYVLLFGMASFPKVGKLLINMSKGDSVFKRVLARMFSAQPYGDPQGLLDPIVLTLGGGIPALIHFNTLTSTNSSTHEVYHFLAHLFTFVMGLLSLSVRLRRPDAKDFTLPVCIGAVACLFTFHHQPNMQSAMLHTEYASVNAAFAMLRIVALYKTEVGQVACFFGAWSAVMLGVASEDGVRWEEHSHLDAPATALFCGILSAVLMAGLMCVFGGGKEEGGEKGRGYERVGLGGGGGDYSDGEDGDDILDILKHYSHEEEEDEEKKGGEVEMNEFKI